MYNKRKLFRFYLHFILPYALLLLLPIFIISYMNYRNYRDILNNEININHKNNLNMIKSQVDAEIITIRNTIYQMSSNTHLKDYINSYTNLDRYKIISSLNSYNYNPFVSDIILYKRNSNRLLSTDCEYTLEEFINYYYRYNEWTEYEFKTFINKLDKDAIRPPENISSYYLNEKINKKKYTTFSYCFPKFTKDFTSTLLILIEESNFHNFIKKHNMDNESVIIIDNNNTLISAYNTNNISKEDIELIYNDCINKHSFVHFIDSKEYLINCVKSSSTNLTYISMCPTSVYTQKIRSVQYRIIVTIIVILLTGIILLTIFMKKNYTPIFNIHNLISNSNVPSNYLQEIESAITSLTVENRRLNNMELKYRPLIKNNYLNELFGGNYNTIDEFNNIARYNITFSSNNMFIFIISGICYSSEYENNEIKKLIELFIQQRLNAYSIDNTLDKTSYIFICSKQENDILEAYFEETIQYINETFKTNCIIGVGNTISTIDQLEISFLEAKTAIQYSYVKGNNKLIYYNQINYMDNTLDFYPIKLFENINNAIQLKDVDEVHKNIDILYENIKTCNQPLHIIQCLSYELITLVLKQIYELNIYDQLAEHKPNFKSIFQCTTIDELVISLKDICGYICQYMRQHNDNKNNNAKDKFINYIYDNCFLYDFSIKHMASFFNISQSSLSQQFKHFTGNTVSHYVDNLRIEKSKSLLKTTNLPIKDIIIQIGYCDSSSFTRKFKQMVGMTPGKYRRLYKKVN